MPGVESDRLAEVLDCPTPVALEPSRIAPVAVDTYICGNQPKCHAIFLDRPIATAERIEGVAQGHMGGSEVGRKPDRLIVIAD